MTDLSYTKGMLFFFILYNVIGEEDFLNAAGSFYQKYKHSGASSEEFLNHVKERAKQNLYRLYQEWIYGTESSRLVLDKIPVEEIIQRYLQQRSTKKVSVRSIPLVKKKEFSSTFL